MRDMCPQTYHIHYSTLPPYCAVAALTQFSIGVSFHPKVLDSIILLAPSGSPGDESQGPWPADCSLLYHSLLREELVGGNVGGIELKYPADNEHGLVTGVLYWHGRGFLRNFLGHEFTSLSKQCGTFRYKTFPGLRNAVVQLMRALYDGNPKLIPSSFVCISRNPIADISGEPTGARADGSGLRWGATTSRSRPTASGLCRS